jgi:hypothetical protein
MNCISHPSNVTLRRPLELLCTEQSTPFQSCFIPTGKIIVRTEKSNNKSVGIMTALPKMTVKSTTRSQNLCRPTSNTFQTVSKGQHNIHIMNQSVSQTFKGIIKIFLSTISCQHIQCGTVLCAVKICFTNQSDYRRCSSYAPSDVTTKIFIIHRHFTRNKLSHFCSYSFCLNEWDRMKEEYIFTESVAQTCDQVNWNSRKVHDLTITASTTT